MKHVFGCLVIVDERVAGREQSEQDEHHPIKAMLRFAGQIAHVVVESVDVE